MENELKTNAVKLSPEEQYQIRKSIVRLSKKGKTDELVNSDLKRSAGSKTSLQSKEVLEHNVRSHLKSFQLNPSKIGSFLTHPIRIMLLDLGKV